MTLEQALTEIAHLRYLIRWLVDMQGLVKEVTSIAKAEEAEDAQAHAAYVSSSVLPPIRKGAKRHGEKWTRGEDDMLDPMTNDWAEPWFTIGVVTCAVCLGTLAGHGLFSWMMYLG